MKERARTILAAIGASRCEREQSMIYRTGGLKIECAIALWAVGKTQRGVCGQKSRSAKMARKQIQLICAISSKNLVLCHAYCAASRADAIA